MMAHNCSLSTVADNKKHEGEESVALVSNAPASSLEMEAAASGRKRKTSSIYSLISRPRLLFLMGGFLLSIMVVFVMLPTTKNDISEDKPDLTVPSSPASSSATTIIHSSVSLPEITTTTIPEYDAAFQLALHEILQNISPKDGGTFIAGAGWTQLWTRDTSYALELGLLALIFPQVAQTTLEVCTAQEAPDDIGLTWLQDQCGHFGGWPHLSDAIVGAQGAWSLYMATGNLEFLQWAYNVTVHTLQWAERDVYDPVTGLFRGCSSFMESNSGYPLAYKSNGEMVGQTKALSTNVLYYNGYTIAQKMNQNIQELLVSATTTTQRQEEAQQIFQTKARQLANAITSRLWSEEQGRYGYFEDGDQVLVTQMEGLGQSLLLLASLNDDLPPPLETNGTRIQQIFQNTYRSSKGIPCLWPRFEGSYYNGKKDTSNYYHNGRIWPFVQGYWALAAARHGQVDIFEEELEHLLDLAYRRQANTTTFAEFYELDGQFPWKRRRQLWSSAGYVGMILQGLFGIHLTDRHPQSSTSSMNNDENIRTAIRHGIRFQPVKGPALAGRTIQLQGLVYRKAHLTIHVSGSGSVVDTFRVNGEYRDDAFLSSEATGPQFIQIRVKEQ